ncbi:TPA: hypothetical protein N6511_003717 [Escherichia coli]|nr:hypothetical protein [Escherichia coli]HAL9443084.1 hypothetical protein [Escherichia coli]HBZ8162453.1 hypothetical protein [Escherichia coli]HBZ8232870.1 hypothetical protein [Escherichia coli]HBZ8349745.1 hypothetical protein [Escherichia coli]
MQQIEEYDVIFLQVNVGFLHYLQADIDFYHTVMPVFLRLYVVLARCMLHPDFYHSRTDGERQNRGVAASQTDGFSQP